MHGVLSVSSQTQTLSMKEQPEKEPLCREKNADKSGHNLCAKNGYYLVGSTIALAGVTTFVGSLASLQMIQVRNITLSQKYGIWT